MQGNVTRLYGAYSNDSIVFDTMDCGLGDFSEWQTHLPFQHLQQVERTFSILKP